MTQTQERDFVISKVRSIVSNEKFKLDAYFFCGCPSGTPNQALLTACEQYLEAVDNGRPDREAAETLIAQLEHALANKSKAADNLVNNDADLQAVLDHRALLMSE